MQKPSILIVDDTPHFLESLSLLLVDDFHILTASEGLEALSIINAEGNLAMILLDLHMPGMNGLQLLKEVRDRNCNIPVLVITGNSSHKWAIECADHGVQGYIEKPVDIDRLIVKIRKVLGIRVYEILKTLWGVGYREKMDAVSPAVIRVLEYINDNYQREFTGEELAKAVNLSQVYLSRQFYKECGIHLKEYVNSLRVLKCKEHLLELDKKISGIALLVGIPDINYLCRLFKKHTGQTPQEFRKKQLSL